MHVTDVTYTLLYHPHFVQTAYIHMQLNDLNYFISQNPSYAPTPSEKTITYRRDCLPDHPMEMHVHVHKIPLHDIFPWQAEDKKERRRTRAISKWMCTCFPKAHSMGFFLLVFFGFGVVFTPFPWDGTLSGSLCYLRYFTYLIQPLLSLYEGQRYWIWVLN